MLVNPVSAKDEDDEKHAHGQGQGYVFHNHKGRTLQPLSKDLKAAAPHARPINTQHHYPKAVVGSASSPHQPVHHKPVHQAHHAEVHPPKTQEEAAVELIRRKVAAVYGDEPQAEKELKVAVKPTPYPSKHQQFMTSLSSSGKSLAQIQTEWHNYYMQLSDAEKHEVWQEFYRANQQNPTFAGAASPSVAKSASLPALTQTAAPKMPSMEASKEAPKHQPVVRDHIPKSYGPQRKAHSRSQSKLKKQIMDKVSLSANSQQKAKEHIKSLAFGIGTGLVVLVIFLFGFFNEMFIAPFVQPSRHVSATPIILSGDSVAASDTPEVIVPKINVQIPAVYDEKSVDEANVQKALERGVIHYATTVLPGQQGNAAFFGHSSNNIFNKGKYKFAFVLLHELVPGDIFYLTYNKTVYSYRVFDKKVVPPTEVSVLNPVQGKPATATLITCDPPGTSTNRLVVWGEQISPDPAGAAAPTATDVNPDTTPDELPSEGPTLWKRFWGWVF